MNAQEYWFLDAAVEMSVNLDVLLSESLEPALNRPGHGLSPAEVVDTLHRLSADGDIVFRRLYRRRPSKWVDLSTEAIDIALRDTTSITTYELTALGGTHWEKVSHPNWAKYYTDSFGTDPEDGEIVSSTRELTERLFVSETCLDRIASPETVVWDTVSPWQATYWKALPVGHRVRYLCKWAQDDTKPLDCAEKRRWRAALRREWYTNPFRDMPAVGPDFG